MKRPKTAKDEDLGIRCPRCGCRRAPVVYTRKIKAGVRRVKQCEHCGRRFSTFERGAGTDL